MAKKSLISGDSLELLLDTMCNTFGGVMFIAIALMVISAFIPKVVSELDETATDEKRVKELQVSIAQLQEELKEKRKQHSLKQQIIEKYKNHPNLDKLKELAAIKAKCQELHILTSDEKIKKLNLLIAVKKANREQIKAKATLTKAHLKLNDLNDETIIVDNNITITQGDIDKFNAATPQETRTIGVKPRTETETTPYIVVMKDNILYKVNNFSEDSLYDGAKFDHSDDVRVEIGVLPGGDGQKAILIHPLPGKGTRVDTNKDNSARFGSIFSNVNHKKRFVWVIVNKDSFKGFMKLRSFLRKKKFKIYWYPVENEYLLTIANRGKYEAGE